MPDDTPNDTYDLIVIGAGPAGENAADYAQKNGLKAVVVERELVGGECSYWACMPSKALLRPGEVLAAARRVSGAKQAITGELDVEAVLQLRDSFSSNWDDQGQVDWLEGVGIELIRGHGRITGERTVTVEKDDGSTVELTASRAVVVATGTGAAVPPIDGLRDINSWDNRDITEAKEIPNRLLVLGGGVVGVEMAQAFRRLGAEVTVVEALDRLLGREEEFVGAELRAVLEDEGITVITGAKMVKAARDGSDGPVTATLENGDTIEGDEILVAVGRRPHTADIGLESIGLEAGGYIEVDDHLVATGVEGDWLYAIGDVNGRSLLTHQGKYQARLVGERIAGKDVDPAWADDTAVPRVVFTDPQVAAVGLVESDARERGINVRTVSYDIGHTAGGALMGKGVGGTAQLVIDQDRRVIVGATMVGPGVGEMIHAATIAIVGEVPIAKLWHAVPSFPTMSEVWLRLLEEDRAAG